MPNRKPSRTTRSARSTRSAGTTARGRASSADAVAVLKKDHETVRGLLKKLAATTDRNANTRTSLLSQIESEIKIHTQIEEEIFYPAFREAVRSKDDKELYFEALEEHGVVDMFMPKLQETDVQDETFGAKAKVLKDLIEHHAEEEETEMFPKARKVMGKAELIELGAQLRRRKEELKPEVEGWRRKVRRAA
jgi:hemerythrin-like domain-containing protein